MTRRIAKAQTGASATVAIDRLVFDDASAWPPPALCGYSQAASSAGNFQRRPSPREQTASKPPNKFQTNPNNLPISPNYPRFLPNKSKHMFGGFVGFQGRKGRYVWNQRVLRFLQVSCCGRGAKTGAKHPPREEAQRGRAVCSAPTS